MKDFGQKCFYDAVIKCEWTGNDPEYYRLRDVQKKFQDKCSESEMHECLKFYC